MLFERSGATALISIAALAVNLIGDLVLVGALGMGVSGPALATAASLGLVAAGYLRVASGCLDVPARFPSLALVAAGGGALAAIALPPGWALCATVAALAVAVAVISRRRLVDPADVEIIVRLGLPAFVERGLLRLLGAARA
jgi:O-antigen/teichoic acid export membrane protein